MLKYINFFMLTISNAISKTSLKSALVPFVTVGYPSLTVTSEVVHLLDREGVNAIELGIPYSDALADGPIIQESSRVALSQHISINQILAFIKDLSSSITTPLIVFTYLNPILSKGIHSFIKEIAEAGVKGLIIPDLPVEESDYVISICHYYELELILFISPASSEARIQKTILKAPGCIYLVSSYGVTGLRDNLGLHLFDFVKKIKDKTSKRIMLGFGISNDKQVAEIMKYNLDIDAIVMGTAFIRQITYGYSKNDYKQMSAFCQNIKQAMSF